MNDQMVLDGNSKELYERGRLVAHSSDGDGMPDVGMSIGLGNGSMLYAGEAPGRSGWSLVIYNQHSHVDVATGITDTYNAIEMIEQIAGSINK